MGETSRYYRLQEVSCCGMASYLWKSLANCSLMLISENKKAYYVGMVTGYV